MSEESVQLLILMFGGTTTKIAIYEKEDQVVIDTLQHSLEEMSSYRTTWDQYDIRKQDIVNFVESHNYAMDDFDAIVSSSGLIGPTEPGVYEINEKMIQEAKAETYGRHTSNVGSLIVYDLAHEYGAQALTVDPSNDVNMLEIAKLSGLKEIQRPNSYHVLNQKAQAIKAAKKINKEYTEAKLIVAHIGSGTTVGAHDKGKVIDVNNGIESDGPFSAVRSGAVPVGPLVDMCYSGKYTLEEMHNKLGVKGGLASYLGTSDGEEIEDRIQKGDREAELAVEAMAYQVAKEIGARSITLKGQVDAVVITGGMANWKRVTDLVTEWVDHLGPVFVYPGENELESLAEGALRYFAGEEELKLYS